MNALINVNNFRVGVACVVSPDAIGWAQICVLLLHGILCDIYDV